MGGQSKAASEPSHTGSLRRERRPAMGSRHSQRSSAAQILQRRQSAQPPLPPHDPFSSLDLLEHATPQFVPFSATSSPERDRTTGEDSEGAHKDGEGGGGGGGGDESRELDSDEEMQDREMDAFALRLKSLIELGTDALASRPKLMSTSPTRSLIVEENRPLPPPVSTPVTRHERRRSAIPVASGSGLAQSASRGTPSRLPTSPKQVRGGPRGSMAVGQYDAAGLGTPGSGRRHAKRESLSGAIPLPVPRSAAMKLSRTTEYEEGGSASRSGTPSRHAARQSWGGSEYPRRVEEQARR